ncbi:LysR substrate-binding domain-containing protein [Ensifer canadensis]
MPDTLRVGGMESTAAARLPFVLQAFKPAPPNVAARLTMGSSAELARAVIPEEIDCALIARMLATRPSPRLPTCVACLAALEPARTYLSATLINLSYRFDK